MCTAPSRPSLVPAELSNAESLALYADWARLPVYGEGMRRQQSSADRQTGEKQRLALWDHNNRDFNNFVCRSAGADVPPNEKVPYVFDAETCVDADVAGAVMARFEGSGRLARIWLTAGSFRTAPPDRETLRIYVDDEPAIELGMAEALDGSASEMFAPPFGAGSTRRMAWYYPLVFSRRLVVAVDHLAADDQYFYQTDVVLDVVPRERRRHDVRANERDDALALLRNDVPLVGSVHARRAALQPGQSVALFDLSGPATIVKTRLIASETELPALRETRLRVRWDDSAEPAIDVPLADLFAAIQAVPEVSGQVLAVERGGAVEVTLQLPMPFSRRALWELEGSPRTPVDVSLVLETQPGVPSAAHGRLHVQRHETRGPSDATHHPLAIAHGRGRLVGTCVAMHGHGLVERSRPGHPLHFLEGDEVATIDGAPALSGTGTEDYFNGAFYFDDGPSATPFAQVWNIVPRLPDAPREGQTTACRWHVLGDAIDFREALDLKLEIGPGVPAVLDRYTSIAFLYLDAPR